MSANYANFPVRRVFSTQSLAKAATEQSYTGSRLRQKVVVEERCGKRGFSSGSARRGSASKMQVVIFEDPVLKTCPFYLKNSICEMVGEPQITGRQNPAGLQPPPSHDEKSEVAGSGYSNVFPSKFRITTRSLFCCST